MPRRRGLKARRGPRDTFREHSSSRQHIPQPSRGFPTIGSGFLIANMYSIHDELQAGIRRNKTTKDQRTCEGRFSAGPRNCRAPRKFKLDRENGAGPLGVVSRCSAGRGARRPRACLTPGSDAGCTEARGSLTPWRARPSSACSAAQTRGATGARRWGQMDCGLDRPPPRTTVCTVHHTHSGDFPHLSRAGHDADCTSLGSRMLGGWTDGNLQSRATHWTCRVYSPCCPRGAMPQKKQHGSRSGHYFRFFGMAASRILSKTAGRIAPPGTVRHGTALRLCRLTLRDSRRVAQDKNHIVG